MTRVHQNQFTDENTWRSEKAVSLSNRKVINRRVQITRPVRNAIHPLVLLGGRSPWWCDEKKWARLVMCHVYRETVNSGLLVRVFRTTLATATNTLLGPRLFMEIYFSVDIAARAAAAAERASFAASANSDESIFNVKRQAGLSGCLAAETDCAPSRPPRMDQKRADCDHLFI